MLPFMVNKDVYNDQGAEKYGQKMQDYTSINTARKSTNKLIQQTSTTFIS